MNKTDLVNAIAVEAKLTKAQAKDALEATLKAIGENLKNGEKVTLIGFGTFSVKENPAHMGRNPRTKEAIEIPAKKVIKFKAGAELNSKL